MSRRIAWTALVAFALLLGARNGVAETPPPLVFDFETADPDIPTAAGESGNAALLAFGGSDTATYRLQQELDLSRFETLRFRVRLPKVSAHMHVAAFFLGARDTWYQTWRPIRPEPGGWETVEIDLRPEAGMLAPVNHSKPWGPYSAQRISEFGIQVFADRPLAAEALLDDIQFIPGPDAPVPNRILNYEVSSERVGRYEEFEITFELSRFYPDPYDPARIEILGEFTAPGGARVTVPGFYYQGYERSLDRSMERLVPVGPPKWKVRYAPRQEGEYEYRLIIRDGDTLETAPERFMCVASEAPGFARVSSDTRYFEFDDGEFFYPVGHNIPATFNVKAAEMLGVAVNKFEGTFAYDRYLDGMASAGENFGRIWLGSWSFGLEWSHSYHPAYEGLGRYNQENAWRLDYVVDKAEDLGVYLQVALTTFGHWSIVEKEGDWPASPYSKVNGGPLNKPWEFWSDEPSQEMYQRMVRYVMARWGYSRGIASWEMSNEVDLVSEYAKHKEEVRDWHLRCAKTIRRFDPNPHMLTTNFAQASREEMILSLPEISYSSTNHYRVNIVEEMRRKIFPQKAEFRKPAIMTECGQDFRGSTPESTVRYLHIGLWSTYMMPFGASGMPWWWDFIDDRNLYHLFTPLTRFAEGEDRRNRGLEMTDGVAEHDPGRRVEGLSVLALRNNHEGYFWVYEEGLERSEGDALFEPYPREGTGLRIGGLRPGRYQVEFWDTWEGGKRSELTAEVKDGTLRAPIPTFTSDIAGKFRPLDAEKRPGEAPTEAGGE
jgi:hypothetical protein